MVTFQANRMHVVHRCNQNGTPAPTSIAFNVSASPPADIEAGRHLFEFGAMIADGETIALEWHVTARSANAPLTTTTTAGSSWSAMAGSPRCASTWIPSMRFLRLPRLHGILFGIGSGNAPPAPEPVYWRANSARTVMTLSRDAIPSGL